MVKDTSMALKPLVRDSEIIKENYTSILRMKPTKRPFQMAHRNQSKRISRMSSPSSLSKTPLQLRPKPPPTPPRQTMR